MSAVDIEKLELLVERLQRMVREEQQLIQSGRLEDVAAAVGERRRLMETIDLESVPPGPILGAIHEIREVGDRTLTLLCALRDELSVRMGQGKEVKKAVGQYERSSSL